MFGTGDKVKWIVVMALWACACSDNWGRPGNELEGSYKGESRKIKVSVPAQDVVRLD